MARSKRFTKVGLNTSLMIDTGIAALIVDLAPGLVNKFLFASNPLTGQMSTLAGVGAAYLYGMLMKNPNVANIGIALGAVSFVKPYISELTGGLSDYGFGDYGNLSGTQSGGKGKYFSLSEYTNNAATRQSVHEYSDSY